MLLKNPLNRDDWVLDFNSQIWDLSGNIWTIPLCHTASIIMSCIWKYIHILMCMNLINPIQFLTCRELRTHQDLWDQRSWLLTGEHWRTSLHCSWTQQHSLGFFFVRSPSPLESWGNCTLIPPILGKSMVIKLTATWRLSWMPVTEKEDYCHFLRSSRNPEQRVVVK